MSGDPRIEQLLALQREQCAAVIPLESIHPRVVAIECQRMADQLRDMRRLLRNTKFRGLAQLVHHAQLELELVTVNAKEAAEHE